MPFSQLPSLCTELFLYRFFPFFSLVVFLFIFFYLVVYLLCVCVSKLLRPSRFLSSLVAAFLLCFFFLFTFYFFSNIYTFHSCPVFTNGIFLCSVQPQEFFVFFSLVFERLFNLFFFYNLLHWPFFLLSSIPFFIQLTFFFNFLNVLFFPWPSNPFFNNLLSILIFSIDVFLSDLRILFFLFNVPHFLTSLMYLLSFLRTLV